MQHQKFNEPVPGTIEVQTCETRKTGAHAEVMVTGMLSIPGLVTLPAEFHDKIPETKVPVIGQTLPVIVDRADPTEFRVEWETVAVSPDTPWELATATVLTCHTAHVPTSASEQAPGGIVDLTINVLLSDGYQYGTKTRVAFSTLERRARATEKGAQLPVRVDPADPNRIVIDIDRIPHW
jgi:hypothetical protein